MVPPYMDGVSLMGTESPEGVGECLKDASGLVLLLLFVFSIEH